MQQSGKDCLVVGPGSIVDRKTIPAQNYKQQARWYEKEILTRKATVEARIVLLLFIDSLCFKISFDLPTAHSPFHISSASADFVFHIFVRI